LSIINLCHYRELRERRTQLHQRLDYLLQDMQTAATQNKIREYNKLKKEKELAQEALSLVLLAIYNIQEGGNRVQQAN